MIPEVGDTVYVPTSLHLSRGSDDFIGGLATVTWVGEGKSAGKMVTFVEVAEKPGSRFNWAEYLEPNQETFRLRYGEQRAHPDPDEDRPWIEEGDTVFDENGPRIHKGSPIW